MNCFSPKNWIKNCKTFESCNSKIDEILGKGYDLFGDHSIVLYPLPGHAAGQYGALVQTKNIPVFLVADAFWDMRAITHKMGPDPIVRLFFDDWKAYHTTLDKLREFHKTHPTIPLFSYPLPQNNGDNSFTKSTMMNVIFKFEVLKSILKLYFQRKAFERNPKKHQQRMWRKFQSTVLPISPFYRSYLKKRIN